MRLSDVIRESFLNLRRRPARTAFAAGGVAVGALAVALLLSLGAGLHNFVEAQALAFSDPAELEIFPEPRASFGDILNYALGQFGTPAKPIEEERKEQQAMMRAFQQDRPRFNDDQIRALRAMPMVIKVEMEQRAWVHSIALEGQTSRFRADLRATYSGPQIPLAAGAAIDPEAEPAQAIVAWQWVQSFGLTRPEELVGKTLSLAVSGSRRQRYDVALPYREDPDKFRVLKVVVAGVTAETIASRAVFVPRAFVAEVRRARNELRAIAEGRDPDEKPKEEAKPPPKKGPHNLIVRARSASDVPALKKALLGKGYGVIALEDRLGVIGRIFLVIDAVLASVGAVAFLVASLGIANTLIMAVHERVAEIGLWKAMGTTNKTVGLMFAVEAASMGFLGGLLGIGGAVALGGIGDAVASRVLMENLIGYEVFIFPWWLMFATVGLATVISFLAGIFPARRAARLAPVAALRRED